MKRGAIIGLEALVKLVPTVLITVALLFIIGLFINSFMNSNKTVEEQDFARIRAEVDELVKAPGEITVPISNPSGMKLATYPADKSPARCNNHQCLCIYYVKDGKSLERCEIYEKFKDCSGDCKSPCILEGTVKDLPATQKTITLKRSCNAITIQ